MRVSKFRNSGSLNLRLQHCADNCALYSKIAIPPALALLDELLSFCWIYLSITFVCSSVMDNTCHNRAPYIQGCKMQTDTWSCKSITDFAARLQYDAVNPPCPVDYLFLYVLRVLIISFHFYFDSLFFVVLQHQESLSSCVQPILVQSTLWCLKNE